MCFFCQSLVELTLNVYNDFWFQFFASSGHAVQARSTIVNFKKIPLDMAGSNEAGILSQWLKEQILERLTVAEQNLAQAVIVKYVLVTLSQWFSIGVPWL